MTAQPCYTAPRSIEWGTPPEFFAVLDAEFGFTLDVAASDENAKCARYFTKADEGLMQDWSGEVCWMNPPYGREIGHWMRKAYETGLDGTTVVCLVPARTDTRWWWDFATRGEVRFVKGRLAFTGGTQENPESHNAPFPVAVVIFGREPHIRWGHVRGAEQHNNPGGQVTHTAENDAPFLHDEDGPYLPGHHDVSYDLTTPREFTARGGWNIRCECGVAVGETGDEDFQERWITHLTSVTPPGSSASSAPATESGQA